MLVGRDREVEELDAAVARLASGVGALFLFSGEPGIGKTRLATDLVERARARGVRAAWGHCWEAGGAPALWPWREAVESLGGEFPDPATIVASNPDEARFGLFRAVTSTLGRDAARAPCVIVLEDLHAADRSSLLLLEFVASQLRSLPLVVAGTFRDLEASLSEETAAALARAGRNGRVFQLARLREAEVAALVADALGDADEAVHATVYRTTLGNPLFVDEIVRDMRASGGRTGQIPLGVREIIRQRLALVPPAARRVLEAGAVLGVEFAAAEVARIDADAAAVFEEATRSGLVVARGHRLRFSHALYREALYHDLPRARRQALHADAARALAGAGAPLSEIAHHLLESGPDAAAAAVEHSVRAAGQALAVFAFEDATALLERARDAIPVGPLERALRCRVMIAEAEVRIRAGDAAGRGLCVEAARLARDLGDPELLALAGLAYGAVFLMGGVDPALVAMLEESLAGLGERRPALRARVMARLAAARQPSPPADRPRDIQLAFEAIELARRVAEPRELLEVLHSASGVLYGAAEPNVRLPITRELERLAEELGDTTRLLLARVRRAYDHLELGDLAAHAQLATDYEALADRLGPVAAPWRVPLMRSTHAIFAGDFAASERLQADAQRLAYDQPRAHRAIAFHRICFLRAAERHAQLRAAIPELRGLWLQMPYGVVIAEPRVASALARIGAEDELRALLASLPEAAWDEEINSMSLVEALWLTGDASRVPRVRPYLRRERWMAYWFDCEVADSPGTRQAAYAAALVGDWAECEQLFGRALRDVEAIGHRALAARMRFELGDLMLRRGREPARARVLVAEGRAGAAALGLDELVALIDRRHPAGAEVVAAPAASPSPSPPRTLALVREGEYYAIATPRGTLRFKATRGMQYLARLVEHPGVEIHVLDLAGASDADRGDAGELVDGAAVRSYRARLAALKDALDDAEAIGDADGAERARDEMEAIAGELARVTGPGGRARRAESAVDRARSAVQRRIKDAIDRIAEQDPELGHRLRRAIRTGNHCSYNIL